MARTTGRTLPPNGSVSPPCPKTSHPQENRKNSTPVPDTKISESTSRVLSRGILGASPKEEWKLRAYEQYKATLNASNYPCFFGQTGEVRGEMLYTFVTHGALNEM